MRFRRTSLLLPVAALTFASSPAWGGPARADALAADDLLVEDSSNIYLNPAHVVGYGNRAWFSLGLAGTGSSFTLSPHGGAAVRIKDSVTLGLVLNRATSLYAFDAALMPVYGAYVTGGVLAGPAGNVADIPPMRFPLDFFAGFGSASGPFRAGLNVYYAGGTQHDWNLSDYDDDGIADTDLQRAQTHLLNATVGVQGGAPTDRTRAEGWFRLGWATAWHEHRVFAEAEDGTDHEDFVDQVTSMDRDLRFGGGFRIHLGDPHRGFVVTPGFRYDVASGAFRFDDNMESPDSLDEQALRQATAHDALAGLAVAWRADDLLVRGDVQLGLLMLEVADHLATSEDDAFESALRSWDVRLPTVSVGAEYRVLPPLLVRAGLRSTVVGGRTVFDTEEYSGPNGALLAHVDDQQLQTSDPSVTLQASGGLGLEVKRLRVDALLGALIFPTSASLGLGGTSAQFFSRLDLSVSFD